MPQPWEWVGIMVLVIGLGLAMMYLMFLAPMRAWEDRLRATEGLQRSEAITTLGEPRRIISRRDDLGKAFDGYNPRPTWPVKNEVLQYERLNVRGYLFVDDKDVVEHVAFAGT